MSTEDDDFLKSFEGKFNIPGSKPADEEKPVRKFEEPAEEDAATYTDKYAEEHHTEFDAEAFFAGIFNESAKTEETKPLSITSESSAPQQPEENGAPSWPASKLNEDEFTPSKSVYYAPGEMLEGQRRVEVETPEGWETRGSAFQIKRGRHEALIESSYSTELDGPRPGQSSTLPTKYFIYGLIGLVVLATIIFFVLSSLTVNDESSVDPLASDPFTGEFYVIHEDPLAKTFPSEINKNRPIEIKYKKYPKETQARVIVADDRHLLATKSKDMVIEPSGDKCADGSLNRDRSVCHVGTVAGTGQKIYYSIDIVHSDLQSKLARFEKMSVPGDVFSIVTILAGKPTQLLIVVNNDNTGWAITVPDNTDLLDMNDEMDKFVFEAYEPLRKHKDDKLEDVTS